MQEVVDTMAQADVRDYTKVKTAILETLNLSDEAKHGQKVHQRFLWPNCKKDTEQYGHTCPECQKVQTRPPPGEALISIPLVEKSFD